MSTNSAVVTETIVSRSKAVTQELGVCLPGDRVHGADVGQDSRQAVVHGCQALLLVQGLPAGVQRSQILQIVPCLIQAVRQLHNRQQENFTQSWDCQASMQELLTAIATDIKAAATDRSVRPNEREFCISLVSRARHQLSRRARVFSDRTILIIKVRPMIGYMSHHHVEVLLELLVRNYKWNCASCNCK